VNRRKPHNRPDDTKDEFERIAWLSKVFAQRRTRAGVDLGIGDDAAILSSSRQRWVWTVDACVEHVHFDWNWLSPEDVGWRSFQAAVSDIAAMGAEPVAALSSMALPDSVNTALWRGIVRGQSRAATSLECPVIGGNLSRAAEVSLHTTVLGRTNKPILRSGALPGDELWLVGVVGAAAAGLSVLRRVPERDRSPAMRACLRAWRRPTALIKEGLQLRGRAHAAIDVSDGIAGDAGHISESSGVRLVLERQALEQAAGPRVRQVATEMGRAVLDWVLLGGEDYALLAAGPASRRPTFATRIGCVERGKGVWLDSVGAKRVPIGPGFDHFRGNVAST